MQQAVNAGSAGAGATSSGPSSETFNKGAAQATLRLNAGAKAGESAYQRSQTLEKPGASHTLLVRHTYNNKVRLCRTSRRR